MGDQKPTHVLGFDARGFLLGTPIALALGVPFVMLRKQEKSPGVLIKSTPYSKEYKEVAPDTMVIRRGSIGKGDRVVLVDDLIATGGTALSGFELCNAVGASVVDFMSVIAIPFCDGITKIREYKGGAFKDVTVFTLIDDGQIGDNQCRDPVDWPEGRSRTFGVDEV
jgi:adenine phosphoribosyltransferase